MITFQEMLRRLSSFWEEQGCVIHQPYDLETGAGTFNPATFLRCLGPEPYKAFYFEPCRRPTDGRYGTNPNRVQHYFQGQAIIKPSPPNILELYLQSLEAVGFDLGKHDVRFVHDDWESPTLGAWGLGWEVWMDGMEITQFTYFQSLGGISLRPITAEITYGLERMAIYLQKTDSIFDIQYNDELTYGDIYFNNEVQWSHYNFEQADTKMWLRHFEDYEKEAKKLAALNLPIPAYDFVIKSSHAFNLLDARGTISVTERTGYIARIRDLAKKIAESYVKSREDLHFPLLQRFQSNLSPDEKQEAASLVYDKHPEEMFTGDPKKQEDFVLEIGTEELPDTFVPIGCRNLYNSFKQVLEKEGISYQSLKCDGTPRRITVYIHGLALGKPPKPIEKKGPSLAQAYDSNGALTAAGEGFFRSLRKEPISLKSLKDGSDPDISIRDIKGTDYLYASITIPGKATADILSEQIPGLIVNLDFPKKMRWGDLDIEFARPIRWMAALFGKHVLPFSVGDLKADRISWGHRQLCPWNFVLVKAQDYYPMLREHKVMVEMHERQKAVVSQLDALEKVLGGKIICREQVVPAVVNLVEWPQLTHSSFDKSFLKVPKEVIISEMVVHQKYFPVSDADGSLKNSFVITANTNPTDQIREGNRKVLSARLSDGAFLYEQGLKVPLDSYNDKLKQVTFQKDLGSVYEKIKRIESHALYLQSMMDISSKQKVKRAAELCKADLASEMVYEFPELQGTIGRYYAAAQQEDPEVSQAIEEHWMPRGENTPLPHTDTGSILSLADKIDNLLGCFLVNLKPTSSSDPYALRRQALGIIKILIKGQYRIPIGEIFSKCLRHFPSKIIQNSSETLREIEEFIINRIRTVFQDYGFNKDEIEAVVSFGVTDIYDAFCKVEALNKFRQANEKFPLLCEVYKRAKGQLNDHNGGSFNSELLKEKAEKELDRLLTLSHNPFKSAIESRHYDKAYETIAQLQPALANLFNEVKILDDDPAIRNNRIALLHRVFERFSQLLDFSKIQK